MAFPEIAVHHSPERLVHIFDGCSEVIDLTVSDGQRQVDPLSLKKGWIVVQHSVDFSAML
jgi:hypothetical protein|tara:strand:+ start:5852 stop:6031 length:180 start_codon:yes stop_codon:yes gene_type:complete